jgi:pimeloyl-ACP methyl ester carboxylesterase
MRGAVARGITALGVIALSLTCCSVAAAATPTNDPHEVVHVPVAFRVLNTNTSGAPCLSDGAAYTVRGHLVGQRAALGRSGGALTIYLYGYEGGEWNWDLKRPGGYAYAERMARAGHVSLTLDELGYGSSGRPSDGNDVCVGSEADVTHQIIGQLRQPSYAATGQAPVRFGRVVLAGHDVGGLVAEVEAAAYADIDGLILVTWADQGQTPWILQRAAVAGIDWCTAEPSGYVHFATEEDWRTLLFYRADPAVIDATDRRRNVNPCGIVRSVPQTVVLDDADSRMATVTAPVLVVFGDQDTLIWSRSAEEQQQNEFTSSDDRSTAFIPDAGHFPMFERSESQFRAVMGAWLDGHGA